MSLENLSSNDFKLQFIDLIKSRPNTDTYHTEVWTSYLNDKKEAVKLFQKNNDLRQLCLLKPKIIKEAYKFKRHLEINERIHYFFTRLGDIKLLNFLLEYSYPYKEKQIIDYLKSKTKYPSNQDFYKYVLDRIPIKYDSTLFKIFPDKTELRYSFVSHTSPRRTSRNSRYRRNTIRPYKTKKERKLERKLERERRHGKTKTQNKKTKTTPRYLNQLTKKYRKQDMSSYYTKKYKDLIESYSNNTSFSKCQSVAKDSYKKYRCNFFYNKCPEGWKKERSGKISKCNCNGSSYKYYNNIFDCNPYLGVISGVSEINKDIPCDEIANQEEYGICFNKTYNEVDKLHQKNKEYYEKMMSMSNQREISKLSTSINVNTTKIETLASEIKAKFPKQDFNDYIFFADFIKGYLMDPLNFIEDSNDVINNKSNSSSTTSSSSSNSSSSSASSSSNSSNFRRTRKRHKRYK